MGKILIPANMIDDLKDKNGKINNQGEDYLISFFWYLYSDKMNVDAIKFLKIDFHWSDTDVLCFLDFVLKSYIKSLDIVRTQGKYEMIGIDDEFISSVLPERNFRKIFIVTILMLYYEMKFKDNKDNFGEIMNALYNTLCWKPEDIDFYAKKSIIALTKNEVRHANWNKED